MPGTGVNEAYEQMKIARLSIEQSTENLRLNTDYYKAGTCTMSDLLDAQTLYQQSCDKYVESYTDYELKKENICKSRGVVKNNFFFDVKGCREVFPMALCDKFCILIAY